jgi:hypothetical protein
MVRRVHEEGMEVHALRPMPTSPKLVYPRAHYVAVTYVRDFLKFNSGLDEAEQFDGLLLDVRPDSLPGWAENRNNVQQYFVDFVLEMRKTVIEFQANLPMGWALPVSFSSHAWFGQLYEYLDYAVLEEVGDDAETITERVAGPLGAAAPTGTRVYIGLETRVPGEKGVAEESFCEEGLAALDEAVQQVTTRFGAETAFAGTAIADDQSLAELSASP